MAAALCPRLLRGRGAERSFGSNSIRRRSTAIEFTALLAPGRSFKLSTSEPPSGLSIMRRVTIQPASSDREKLDIEIARLRGLDVGELRARWHTVFRRRASSHLPRHLLFAFWPIGFRPTVWATSMPRPFASSTVQDHLLMSENLQPSSINARTDLQAGTVLVREWDGQTASGHGACRWLCLE